MPGGRPSFHRFPVMAGSSMQHGCNLKGDRWRSADQPQAQVRCGVPLPAARQARQPSSQGVPKARRRSEAAEALHTLGLQDPARRGTDSSAISGDTAQARTAKRLPRTRNSRALGGGNGRSRCLHCSWKLPCLMPLAEELVVPRCASFISFGRQVTSRCTATRPVRTLLALDRQSTSRAAFASSDSRCSVAERSLTAKTS